MLRYDTGSRTLYALQCAHTWLDTRGVITREGDNTQGFNYWGESRVRGAITALWVAGLMFAMTAHRETGLRYNINLVHS
jgi:hypothetical protein